MKNSINLVILVFALSGSFAYAGQPTTNINVIKESSYHSLYQAIYKEWYNNEPRYYKKAVNQAQDFYLQIEDEKLSSASQKAFLNKIVNNIKSGSTPDDIFNSIRNLK